MPRRMRFAVLTLVAGLCLAVPAEARMQQGASSEKQASPGAASITPLAAFMEAGEAQREEIVAIRRDIHRHPEPSGSEERTAGIVADWLRGAGFDVTTGVGGHGVVGVLRGTAAGSDETRRPVGPVLAFRADMDAVRGRAADPMEFRSVVPGVHHICGHDIHTAVGLALATGFSAIRDRLPGTVVLIFQPAEETASGARAMLEDGIFDGAIDGGAAADGAGVPDAIFAYHTAPLPVGQVMTRAGTLLPGRDRVRVEIAATGDGVRGDLADVVPEVRTLLAGVATPGASASTRPASEPFVVVRGLRSNAAGPGVHLVGATLTTAGPEASHATRDALEGGLEALRRPGLELRLDYEEGWIEGAKNDPDLARLSSAAARRVLGEDAVREARSITTIFSEDFGSFQARVPGVMYFLGVSNLDRGWVGMPHSPTYVADEEAIFTGAEVMGAILLDLLSVHMYD